MEEVKHGVVEVKDATFGEEKKVEANNKRLSMEVRFQSLLSRINRKVVNFDLNNNELIDIKQNNDKIDNLVIRKDPIKILEQLGRVTTSVGDKRSVCEHSAQCSAYSVRLPLLNGNDATLSGLCLDKQMADFPNYPLGKVAYEIKLMCEN